jgi:anti-sigma factor RsiW
VIEKRLKEVLLKWQLMAKDDEQELLYKYLLGELPEEQQAELEQRYFTDDALFERLIAVEDELINRYARNESSDEERKRIETYFLISQARRKRLMFTQALMRYLASLSEDVRHQRASWWEEMKALLHIKRGDD